MTLPHCHRVTAEITRLFEEDDAFVARFRALAASAFTPEEVTDVLAEHLDAANAQTLREEFRELPRIMAEMLVRTWQLADGAGKPFTFASLMPDAPFSFARQRQVRFVVDVTEDYVTLGVAHVANRKAEWYQPQLAAV